MELKTNKKPKSNSERERMLEGQYKQRWPLGRGNVVVTAVTAAPVFEWVWTDRGQRTASDQDLLGCSHLRDKNLF